MTIDTNTVTTSREPELLGHTVVVIGGSAGIWLETARRARTGGRSRGPGLSLIGAGTAACPR